MNTARGNRFRDEIADFLALKYFEVATEVNVRGKNADVVFTEQGIGGNRTYAVEAKYTEETLKHNEIASIQSDYLAALTYGDISGLIIVGIGELTPHARLALLPTTKYYRFSKLVEEILGLEDYTRFLKDIDAQDRLREYYVEPTFKDQGDAIPFLRDWVLKEDAPALAVLGGYGTGKTSLSRRFAASLASEYRQSNVTRIPILVELGLISTEQDLEGLLGKLFTSIHRGKDFNFHRLLKLNDAGRLIFIFDGFDEMKHAITWDEFVYNFRQLNRLVGPRAKIMILGRPGVLTSEDEYNYVLRGERRIGENFSKVADWPRYIECSLELFDAKQKESFIRGYLTTYADPGTDVEYRRMEIDEKLQQLESLPDPTLILRPVQAKMILDLVTKTDVKISDLNRYTLYKSFIDHIIERETTTKIARRKISAADRRSAARAIAWWLWTDRRVTYFTFGEIEDYIKRLPEDHPLVIHGRESSILRDILLGACLEQKDKSVFYFAHRSFMEFLVAEHVETSAIDSEEMRKLATAFTPEIREFIEANSPIETRRYIQSAFARERKAINYELARFLCGYYDSTRILSSITVDGESSANRFLIYLAFYGMENRGRLAFKEASNEYLAKADDKYLSAPFCAMLLSRGSDVETAAYEHLPSIIGTLLAGIGTANLNAWSVQERDYHVPGDCQIAYEVLANAIRVAPNRRDLIVSLEALAEVLVRHLWLDGASSFLPFEKPWLEAKITVAADKVDQIIEGVDRNARRPLARMLASGFDVGYLKLDRVRKTFKAGTRNLEAKPNKVFHKR